MTVDQSSLQILPDGYRKTAEFNLQKDLRLVLTLNIIGFGLFILAIILLFLYNALVHPPTAIQGYGFSLSGAGQGLRVLGLFLLDMALMLVLHEAAHGLFFWLFTGQAPKVGVGPGYAYAAAPGFYLLRDRYLVVGLAPAVLLTLAGLALVPFASGVFLFYLNAFIALNFSGAVGDFWVVGWLLRKTPAVLVQDFGDRIEVYEPSNPV